MICASLSLYSILLLQVWFRDRHITHSEPTKQKKVFVETSKKETFTLPLDILASHGDERSGDV